MGIFCQINLFKPPDEVFYSGEVVSGLIKYGLDEPMDIEKITISLKGMGYLRITETSNNRNDSRHSYGNNEVYVDTDEVIHEGKIKIPVGLYELKFNFKLPPNVPSSLDYKYDFPKYRVNCKIKYYVRIKFDRPGWFTLAKHFRKEIIVASTTIARLPSEPIVYGQKSNLLQFFSSKTKKVIMKATIANSVIQSGGKIEIQSKIKNDTNVAIKSVETKLIEVYTFRVTGRPEVKGFEDVPHCDSKTGSIKCGDTQNMPIEFIVPSDKVSLDNSKIVSRDYVVKIIAELPIPHRNVVLEIPVQIGDKVQRAEICDPPPSYWEAMGEAKRDDDDDVGNDEVRVDEREARLDDKGKVRVDEIGRAREEEMEKVSGDEAGAARMGENWKMGVEEVGEARMDEKAKIKIEEVEEPRMDEKEKMRLEEVGEARMHHKKEVEMVETVNLCNVDEKGEKP